MRCAVRMACGMLAAFAAGGAQAATLVVCSEANPDALNAALSDANTSFDVTEQIADRLVEMQPGTSNVVPALAESWTVSADGLRYVFRLRHGVKFQSNARFSPTREMNADDVVFSFARMADKTNPYHAVDGGTYAMFDDFIAPALKSVSRLADDEVAFDLRAPSASLLSALTVQSFSIWSAEYAAAMAKAGTPGEIDRAPLGTGPFQLVEYRKDTSIRFRAFPQFWGAQGGAQGVAGQDGTPAARVENLVFSITPDPEVRFARLRAGECQIARYPSPSDLDAMRAAPGIVVQQAPIAAESMLSFRTDIKPLSDLRVRRALVMAIDHDSLVQAVFRGSGVPTSALVPSALWGHNAGLPPYPYDPAGARALLAEAGYPDGFAIDLWAIPVARAYMPNGRRAAEMIQADWAKIGVAARIVTFEWGEFLRRRRAGEAPVAMNGGTWDYPDPSELTATQTCEAIAGGTNVSHWCNRVYSDLIRRADIVTDQAARAQLYEAAQRVFRDDMPSMMFADVQGFIGVRNEVRGFRLHFLGGQPFRGVALAQ